MATPSDCDEAALNVVEQGLALFVKAAAAQEVARLTDAGARVIVLPVANVGVVVESKADGSEEIINRVELATKFDTSVVCGLMLSPPTSIPAHLTEAGRGALTLQFVVLQTPSPIMLLAAVVMEPSAHPNNDLRVWRFVNNKQHATTHVVDFETS